MNNYQLAYRIVFYIKIFYKLPMCKALNLNLNLASAFSWLDTTEGFSFWAELYENRQVFRDPKLFKDYLSKYYSFTYNCIFIDFLKLYE